MKIVLYRDGRPGVVAKLPGDEPDIELSDLLGGETEITPVTGKLCVVHLCEGYEMGMPARYMMHVIGKAPRLIHGDCALVAMTIEGKYRDVTIQEIAVAEEYIRCVGV